MSRHETSKTPDTSGEFQRNDLALRAATEALVGAPAEASIETRQELIVTVEHEMMKGVHGLPEEIARKMNVAGAEALESRANEIIGDLRHEQDPARRAELQKELVFQYITLISRVQGSGTKAFTPELARELGEMDCTLSAWSLKEKLRGSKIEDLKYDFGYPADHAVGIVTTADGKKLYVDAQNGFVAEVDLAQVHDPEQPVTAYPMYEITAARRLSGRIPNEGEVTMARPNGSDAMPKYLGIREDGALHTLGNMHAFTDPESNVYETQTASRFREKLRNDPEEFRKFKQFRESVEGGTVIQDTRFGEPW